MAPQFPWAGHPSHQAPAAPRGIHNCHPISGNSSADRGLAGRRWRSWAHTAAQRQGAPPTTAPHCPPPACPAHSPERGPSSTPTSWLPSTPPSSQVWQGPWGQTRSGSPWGPGPTQARHGEGPGKCCGGVTGPGAGSGLAFRRGRQPGPGTRSRDVGVPRAGRCPYLLGAPARRPSSPRGRSSSSARSGTGTGTR